MKNLTYETRKFILTLFFMLIFMLPVFGPFIGTYLSEYQLNPFDYARITDVEYKAVVQDEPENGGSVLVTERITYDIHAASRNNAFWELWLDLSEEPEEDLKVSYTVHSVKQILPDGREIVYEESPVLYWEDEDYVSSNKELGPGKWFYSPGPYNEDTRDYECVFFYIDNVYREEMVFEIVYEIHDASMRYADSSELYLEMSSGIALNHYESFKADILFPEKDMPAAGNYEAYTYGTSKFNFPFEESDTKYPGYHTFSFDLGKRDLKFVYDTDYIAFDLFSFGDDKHIFTNNAPDHYYSNDDALEEIYEEQDDYRAQATKALSLKWIYFIAVIILSVLFIILATTVGIWIKLKHFFFKPTETYPLFREIPDDLDPNFAAEIVFNKLNKKSDKAGVYSALLLSLVRKKYITIEEQGNTARITILYQKPSGITPLPFSDESEKPTLLERLVAEGPIMTDHSPFESDEITALTWNVPLSEPSQELPEPPQEILEPLTPCEEYLFDLITHHAIWNSITLEQLEKSMVSDYDTTESFSAQMDESIVNIGIDKQFYQKLSYDQAKNFLLKLAKTMLHFAFWVLILGSVIAWFASIGIAYGANFILAAALIFASSRIKKVAHKYILYTQYGEDECAKWVGLYNFLSSDTLMNERTYTEVAIWEKYLVYATAFGIAEKVTEAISIKCPEINESPVLSNDYYRTTRFRHSGHSFHRSVRIGTHTSHRLGGGGYGGAGRGSGAGGGGH